MYSKRTTVPALALALTMVMPLAAIAGKAEPVGPVKVMLAPAEKAHTFAQVRKGDSFSTLLVVALADKNVTVIDLSELSGLTSADAFDVIKRFTVEELDALGRQKSRTHIYSLTQLIGVGPRGMAHIAAGTNYPAHGDEVGVDEAFLFPKISPASGPRSKVTAAPGAMMDYEVEVCARFDRELRSVADFDESRKGFFICGDFSDRATLVRNINLKDVTSGDGFPDAKSGNGRFPTGPFLVVPKDWKAFLDGVVIETYVDGDRRQHANAADMIKDLRTIVKETLDEAMTRTWSYQGGRIPMVDRPAIGTGSAVLTGTGDGVIFKEPGPDVINKLMEADGRDQQLAVIESYLAGEVAKGIYLQPGNVVHYSSNYLGSIDTDVVSGSPANAQESGADSDTVSTEKAQREGWGLGLGTAISSGVYAGEGTRVTPFPLITYESDRFFWRGISGGAHLLKQEGFAIDATLSARMDGIDRSDFGRRELAERGTDRSLLEDRDDALDLGLAATWSGTLGELELDVKGDVTGTSDGYEAGLKYGYPLQWGQSSITPNIGITHMSKKLANYYYGTLPEEVERGVVDYRPGSSTVQRVGVDYVRPFADRWAFIANVSYENLPNRISDSPLVEEDTDGRVSAFFGVSRAF